MCGILLSETELKNDQLELVARRGKDHSKRAKFGPFYTFSSVLSIRSFVAQPIIGDNFALLYNGEIYNDLDSDTNFVKSIIKHKIDSTCPNIQTANDIDIHFKLCTAIFSEINKFEVEAAICIVIGRFVYFFKDDIGKRSLGYTQSPFVLSSLQYSTEVDPLKLYIYDYDTKILHSIFKPRKRLVDQYLNQIADIKQFLHSEK